MWFPAACFGDPDFLVPLAGQSFHFFREIADNMDCKKNILQILYYRYIFMVPRVIPNDFNDPKTLPLAKGLGETELK